MRPTSGGHELEAAAILPAVNGSNHWDAVTMDTKREAPVATGRAEGSFLRNNSTSSAEAYRRLVGTPDISSRPPAAPWSSEGDANIWGRGLPRPPSHSRHSADYRGHTPMEYSVAEVDRRFSLDDLSSLKAIWNQGDARGGAHQDGLNGPLLQHMPELNSNLDSAFGQLNLQNLQPSPYRSPIRGQQMSGIAPVEAQRMAQKGNGWGEQANARQAPLNGHSYPRDPYIPTPLPQPNHSHLPATFPIEPPPVYLEHALPPGPQQMNPYGLPAAKLSPPSSIGLLEGLSPAEMRAALQHPHTAQYIKQLELEALLTAEAQHQPKSLEERLSAARQVAQGMQQLHRTPPPPPPRMVRPALPPPLDTATVQRYLAQTGLGAVNRPPKTSPRNGKERSRLLGSMPKCSMEALDKSLEALVDSLKPSEEENKRQDEAFAQVSETLKAHFAHSKVHQFGSTANSLCICGNNDMDVCLEIYEPEDGQPYKASVVEEIGKLMSEGKMGGVNPLPNARVPVVKFVVPQTGSKVDVTVNNLLAISNTKLLKDYAAVDARLMKLVFIVKHWAKRRQVNDSYRGTLSSYCYVLMCIHFLQNREPPILPSLQAIQPPTYIRTVGHWKCDYFDKPMPGFGKENTESLAELVWKFFEFWAWAHDFNNAVVSVRTGKFLTKAQKDWTRRIGNERHLICIEDPFETSHDLGRTVDRQTSGILHKEFDRAACILRDDEDPLAQLFDPYRAGKAD